MGIDVQRKRSTDPYKNNVIEEVLAKYERLADIYFELPTYYNAIFARLLYNRVIESEMRIKLLSTMQGIEVGKNVTYAEKTDFLNYIYARASDEKFKRKSFLVPMLAVLLKEEPSLYDKRMEEFGIDVLAALSYPF